MIATKIQTISLEIKIRLSTDTQRKRVAAASKRGRREASTP
jgi:hypothetical protein